MAQKRTPWPEKAALIKEAYPLSENLNWHSVFTEDPAILGIIINDILKLDQSRAGKPGKRPSLTEDSTADKLRKIQNVDYAEEPFLKSFRNLCGARSVRAVAAKVSMDKSYVHRLMSGTAVPTHEGLKDIAVGFGKEPSYFLEYRIQTILDILGKKLSDSPESSVVFYKKITGRKVN